uniref:DEK_C domain-containing protein n=1 Tax=Rhabditophanes sp. KR3021 TaxID=114890 RepID=A0AC35UBA2_9BILA
MCIGKPTGEVKQTAWVEQVTKAITNVSDPGLKSILLQVAKYDNIPRKMAKFLNFLNNSLRIHNKDLCESAWKAIESEAIKMREAAIAKSEAAKQKAKEEKEAKEKKAAEDEEGKKNDGVDDVKVTTNNDFKWKSTIKRKLKAADNNTMKIKKLKTAVIEEFVASTGGEVDGTFSIMFEQKLTSAGVVIDGKVARLKQ